MMWKTMTKPKPDISAIKRPITEMMAGGMISRDHAFRHRVGCDPREMERRVFVVGEPSPVAPIGDWSPEGPRYETRMVPTRTYATAEWTARSRLSIDER